MPEAFGRVVWALCLLRGGNTLSSHVRNRGGQKSSYQTTHSKKVHFFWSPDFGLLEDLPEHIKTGEQRYVDVCEIQSVKISCNREYTRTASEEGGGCEIPEAVEAVNDDEDDAPAQAPKRKPWLGGGALGWSIRSVSKGAHLEAVIVVELCAVDALVLHSAVCIARETRPGLKEIDRRLAHRRSSRSS